jgi:stage II sporulation protein E
MQYGAEIMTYRRTKKEERTKKVEERVFYIKGVLYFVAAVLISRVFLLNNAAPFGISFITAVFMQQNKKIMLISGIGSLIGYLTIYTKLDSPGLYLCIVSSIILVSFLTKSSSRKKKLAFVTGMVFIESVIYNYLIKSFSIDIIFFTSLFHLACIIPLYYILNYGLLCLNEIKTKHLFNNEEIISMAIVMALIISGTWGISVFSISIRNILSLGFIVCIAFINGSMAGAAAGIAIGAISGISSPDIVIYIGIYGLCGLVVGLFRETGKWISGFSYLIAFLILKLYSNIGGDFKLIEAIITGGVFLAVPKRIYERLSAEFDFDKKVEQINSNYAQEVKDIFVERLENFSDVLYSMSNIVNNLVSNDKLLMKNKSSALIENLADRVCANCDINEMCWKRELHYTYTAFSELIDYYQQGKTVIPKELERKCIKRTSLLKNTEEIVNNHIIGEMWRNRLVEGRQILSGQINNMAVSVKDLVDEFTSQIGFNNEIEKNIRRLFNKNKIKYKELFCFENKAGRLNVKLSLESCGGSQICVKKVLPQINLATDKYMSVSEEGCRINRSNNHCTVVFEEAPKYHVVSHVARECKSGEKYNGDSYSFGRLKDGTYMVVISDGMGSGPEAGKESKAAVELIEKFTEAGFSKNTAINTVNSIMTLKFTEDEKFSTLDLMSIDLYTGEADFMKVGAVTTFIKRGEKVDIIKSRTLPIGVLDKVDIDVSKKKLKNGDIVVMMSDGLLDSNQDGPEKEAWIIDYLRNANSGNPKDITDDIIIHSKEQSNGKVKDDITIIVSKVYSLY